MLQSMVDSAAIVNAEISHYICAVKLQLYVRILLIVSSVYSQMEVDTVLSDFESSDFGEMVSQIVT